MTSGDGLDRSTTRSRSTEPEFREHPGVEGARSSIWALDGRVRMAFVLFGGMVALQSSPTLDATKIAYLVGTVLCVCAALVAVVRARQTAAVTRGAQWLAASAALAALLLLSFIVARAQGTSIIDWVRDVAAYALFAAVPVLALDGHASTSRKLLVGMLVIAGLLGGLSWAIEWLGRRQIADLPFARLVFPSGELPGLLYLFAMATAVTGGRRTGLWVLLAGLVLGLFLLTGTRSSLLLLIGPLAMMAVAGRGRIRGSLRAFVSHGVVAVGLVLAFQLALAWPALLTSSRTTPDPGSSGPTPTLGPILIGERVGSLPILVGNPSSDPSIKERLAQYGAAWALFLSSPLVGAGPGHPIEWVDVSGLPRAGSAADTPLVLPAKFGLLGVLVFLGVVVAFGSTVRTALRRDRRSAVTLALVGYGMWVIVGVPLGFAVEDKGTSLALMLLLALAFAERAALSTDSRMEVDAVLG